MSFSINATPRELFKKDNLEKIGLNSHHFTHSKQTFSSCHSILWVPILFRRFIMNWINYERSYLWTNWNVRNGNKRELGILPVWNSEFANTYESTMSYVWQLEKWIIRHSKHSKNFAMSVLAGIVMALFSSNSPWLFKMRADLCIGTAKPGQWSLYANISNISFKAYKAFLRYNFSV